MIRQDWSVVMDDPEMFAREAVGWEHPRHFRFMERIGRAFPKHTERVLDVGCGTGTGLIVWSRKVPFVHGIDASHNCVREAQTRAPKATVHEMDVRDLQSLPFVADVVVSTGFLKHFSLREWPEILQLLKNRASRCVIATIGMKEIASDQEDASMSHYCSGVPYHEALRKAECGGWKVVDLFGHPTEPAFVIERI